MKVFPETTTASWKLHWWRNTRHIWQWGHTKCFFCWFYLTSHRRIACVTKASTPWCHTARFRWDKATAICQFSCSFLYNVIHAWKPLHGHWWWCWGWWSRECVYWYWIVIGHKRFLCASPSCLNCLLIGSYWIGDENLGIGTTPRFSSWKRWWLK